MRRPIIEIRVLAASAVGLSGPALAHSGTGLAGGFASGAVHPLSGPDHLLAMVSVGLWGAFLGRPLIYLLPVVFPMIMVLGAIFGMIGLPMPAAEVGIALSVLVLGSCIAVAARPPVIIAATIVGTFAIFHGYAHGRELPSAADPVGYSLGFVIATGLLHVCGILLGRLKDRPHGELAIRTAGTLIAVIGIGFLAASLTA